MRLATLSAAWERFFFEPRSPRPLCLLRLLCGLCIFAAGLSLAPHLSAFFGPEALMRPETVRVWLLGPRLNLLALLPQTEFALRLFYAAFMAAAACLALGLFSRASALLVYLGLVSFVHRNPSAFNCAESVMRAISYFLIFSPCGAEFSIDRILRQRSGREEPGARPLKNLWTLRMIQLQVCFVYLSTVFWKLKGPHWIDGSAVYYASRLDEFRAHSVPYIFDHMWTMRLMSWGTLLIEFALGSLIWIRELRYPVLLIGVLLHLGIDYTMNVPFFSWIMIASYAAFIAADDFEGFSLRRRALRPEGVRARQGIAARARPAQGGLQPEPRQRELPASP